MPLLLQHTVRERLVRASFVALRSRADTYAFFAHISLLAPRLIHVKEKYLSQVLG